MESDRPMPSVPRKVGPSSTGHGRPQAFTAGLCEPRKRPRRPYPLPSAWCGHSRRGKGSWRTCHGCVQATERPNGSFEGIFTVSNLATKRLPSYTLGSQFVLSTAGPLRAAEPEADAVTWLRLDHYHDLCQEWRWGPFAQPELLD
jgi:hypothetical protein